MKSLLLLAAAPILAMSAVMAVNTQPEVGPFPYQSSWKLSMPSGHGTMFPVLRLKNGIVFMTAKHVAKHVTDKAVASHPEYGVVRQGLKVLKMHPTLDLATVFVPVMDKRIRTVLVGNLPKLGDRCTVVAYPGPGRRRITEGNICGPTTMSAQIIGGSSGGPVFNKKGKLIGVVRAVNVKRLSFGTVIPIAWMGYFVPVSKALMAEMLR